MGSMNQIIQAAMLVKCIVHDHLPPYSVERVGDIIQLESDVQSRGCCDFFI